MKNLLLLVTLVFPFARSTPGQKTSMDYLREGSAFWVEGAFGLGFQIPNPPSQIRNRTVACGYGEFGDEDNAIKWLRLAFKYKANMLPGERFPNPEADSSFEKFRESNKFKRRLRR
jgi:hypothetical protein